MLIKLLTKAKNYNQLFLHYCINYEIQKKIFLGIIYFIMSEY
ncbi:MAG: hypothetical protein ACI9XC_002448 [Gammaproteobacteria bacterium]|jgi:hypothetical protein